MESCGVPNPINTNHQAADLFVVGTHRATGDRAMIQFIYSITTPMCTPLPSGLNIKMSKSSERIKKGRLQAFRSKYRHYLMLGLSIVPVTWHREITDPNPEGYYECHARDFRICSLPHYSIPGMALSKKVPSKLM